MSSRPRLDAPSVHVIRAWLRSNRGGIADIMASTGLGLSTVEKALRELRFISDPVLVNAVKSRVGAPIKLRGKRKLAREMLMAREAEEARQRTASLLRSAIATRTPLEQVWGKQA